MIGLPGIPPLRWLGQPGDATTDGARLTMISGPTCDWFDDPGGASPIHSAPALVTAVPGDCQLSARVEVDFVARFDAGVLFVHRDEQTYAKLCFERSASGDAMVVSVVTRGVSDDANGQIITSPSVWLRVSFTGETVAFHHSLDGRLWQMKRLFTLGPEPATTTVGFLAQSPTGSGCTTRFDDITWSTTTLADPRNGS